MSKRTRHEMSFNSPPKKRYPFKPCLSDGLTEEAIENFCRDQFIIQESLQRLTNNEVNAFKTSAITDKILFEISNRIPVASYLERLVLVQGILSEKSISHLCNSIIKSKHIIYLDLRANELSSKSIEMIISCLPFSNISTLNIGNNNCDLSSFSKLSNTCSTVTNLTLDGNIISCSKDIFSCILSNFNSLCYLSLVDCNLEGNDIENLIPFVKNHPSLGILHLSCNPIRLQGIKAICELVDKSIALQEIHIIGVNYTESESQMLVNSLAERKNANLRLFPNILSRRAHYLRRIYPGKDELFKFLELHHLDSHKELFFRFEITLESLLNNKYLLPSLEKYQLSPNEISIIQQSIQIIKSISEENNKKSNKYYKKQLFQHLLLYGVEIIDENDNNNNCPFFQVGKWYNEQYVNIKYFDKLDNNRLYQIQAAGNRLFRLRHPYLLDFLGIFIPEEQESCHLSDSSIGDSHLLMVFEHIDYISINNWIYSKEGNQKIKSETNVEYLILGICIKVCLVMDYIVQQQKIIYSELLLSRIGIHIGIHGEIIPKIWDFGLDSIENNFIDKKERWYPPEGNRAAHADIWMYGIFMWELYSHVHQSIETNEYQPIIPFNEIKDETLLSNILSGVKLNNPGCSASIYHLICECTNPSPTKRPNFTQIYTTLVRHYQLIQPKYKNTLSELKNQVFTDTVINYSDNSDFMED